MRRSGGRNRGSNPVRHSALRRHDRWRKRPDELIPRRLSRLSMAGISARRLALNRNRR
jgi:hypothetical protein